MLKSELLFFSACNSLRALLITLPLFFLTLTMLGNHAGKWNASNSGKHDETFTPSENMTSVQHMKEYSRSLNVRTF